MGLGSKLKKLANKASPIAIDRKVANKVVAPLLKSNGITRRIGFAVEKTVGNERINTATPWKTTVSEHVADGGDAFRAVDNVGGKFTPLQIDNAIARKAPDNPISNFVELTTGKGPADGSDNRYYDSDRNVAIAAAVASAVVGGSALAGQGFTVPGGASTAATTGGGLTESMVDKILAAGKAAGSAAITSEMKERAEQEKKEAQQREAAALDAARQANLAMEAAGSKQPAGLSPAVVTLLGLLGLLALN